ncbi:MAG: YceI family protein [Chitinophagaceae bacterium]
MATTKWILDPVHSELGFRIKHLMITNLSGSFNSFQVEATTTDDDFSTGAIAVTVDMSSINTNNQQRDAHLRNSDFFEVDKHPELKFTSSKIVKEDDDTFVLHGELTLKGISNPVKLDVEYNGITKDPWGSERAGFSVSGKIKRSDWGVSFNGPLETGGMILGEEVKILAEIQLVKEAVAAAV